jgi:hypothetical protein
MKNGFTVLAEEREKERKRKVLLQLLKAYQRHIKIKKEN